MDLRLVAVCLAALIKFASGTKTISPLNSFHCFIDYSVADKAQGYLPKTPLIFERVCGCQSDWKTTFCNNVKHYSKMNAKHSPHVCICRQLNDKDNSCDQFMTRCFADKATNYQTCSCCFNQPDNHCTQLDCKNLVPEFGRGSNTSCICHSQSNYPKHICANRDVSPRAKGKPLFTVTGYPHSHILGGTPTFEIKNLPGGTDQPSFYASVLNSMKSNKMVLAFIIVLVIAVSAAIIFGCGVICFGRRQAARQASTRRQKRVTNEKKLLESTHNDVEGYLP